jgi:predicted dehydrogenase
LRQKQIVKSPISASTAISHPGLTRRQFLTATSAALGLPAIVPWRVLGAGQTPGANERLTVAHIGVGGMGSVDLANMLLFRDQGTVDVAAVCDVDDERLKAAMKRVGGAVQGYRDYRHILERKDIDAVVIATPDHWHPVQCVQACETGKHVYVEKPSSVTIADGRAMVETARRNRRIVQVGSQARSAKPAHEACQFIRNGQLGRVHTVTCWHSLNPIGGLARDEAPRPELDWDLWLGPLPWRPYNASYERGNFRWFLESGGGNIRDRGAHVFSVIRWCLNADWQQPVTIEATGTPPPEGIWDSPRTMKVLYTFKNPDWQLIWDQPGEPKGPADFGMVFHGDKDELIVCRDGTRIDADPKARNFQVPAGGVRVYRMDRYEDYNVNHKADWLQAIKTGTNPCMDIELAHRAATLCILGNLSYMLGRPLQWDGDKEQIIGDDFANRLLVRPQRYPYVIRG